MEQRELKHIDNYSEFALPVSVIVSVMPHRQKDFNDYTLRSIIYNNPKEIIVNDLPGRAAEKWNESFRDTNQPYVYLCSDDFILPGGHIERMLNALKDAPANVGYAYPSSYYCFPYAPENHDQGRNFKFQSVPFDGELLKQRNYIDGSCIWKRDNFVEFDENLKRYLDWDVALYNYLKKGISGVMAPNTSFRTFCYDEGISAKKNNAEDARRAIMTKYNLKY